MTAAPVPTIEHAGALEDLTRMPGYLMPGHRRGRPLPGHVSCSYCGVGDGGVLQTIASSGPEPLPQGEGVIRVLRGLRELEAPARVDASGIVEIRSEVSLASPTGSLQGELRIDGAAV